MKRLGLAIVLTLLGPYNVLAQEAPDKGRLLPFAFVAPGRASDGTSTLHLGGGVETVVWNGLGAGAEIGFLGPLSSDTEGFIYGVGVLSVNGLYEPLKPGRRITPFATGGYTVLFSSASDSGANVGGGFNYWMRDGLALRVQFRDHLRTHPTREYNVSFLEFWDMGVGVTWK